MKKTTITFEGDLKSITKKLIIDLLKKDRIDTQEYKYTISSEAPHTLDIVWRESK